MSSKKGWLYTKVLAGKDLLAVDTKHGCSDPFVSICYGSQTKKTKTQKKTVDPIWADESENWDGFSFKVDGSPPQEILYEVFHSSLFSDKRMGRCKIKVAEVIANEKLLAGWFELTKYKNTDEVSGRIHITLVFVPEGHEKNLSRVPSTLLGQAHHEEDNPLFEAIKNSDVNKVRESMDLYDINQKDQFGYSPIHSACCVFSQKDDEVLELLLTHPKIDLSITNNDGNTPLHYFAQKFRSPTCQRAFKKFLALKADLNAVNNYQETPLHRAILNNSLRVLMCNLLLKGGADVNKANQAKETPLHYSIRLLRTDLVGALLKAGADVTLQSDSGKTPYDLALAEVEENKNSEDHEAALRLLTLLQRPKDLTEWLTDLGMDRYKLNFLQHEIYLDTISLLNENTLNDLQITIAGHRVKIVKAARLVDSQSYKQKYSVIQATRSPEADNAETIMKELNKLKYQNIERGDWLLDHSDLEFTVKLGTGTSGFVYKGLYLKKEVAIKVLKTDESEEELNEFKKEFQIMNTVQSPHLVFFFGACLSPKMCMVMELCAKGSLQDVMIDRSNAWTWDRILNSCSSIAEGIKVLHQNSPQIVHRDLKSLNVMLNDYYQCKVGDFGLSRFNTETQKETLKQTKGTYAYCSPEVYFGNPYSSKSDIFAMGIVFWEMVRRFEKGKWESPYEEYPQLKFDFQILIQSSKNGKRCTIPEKLPACWHSLIAAMWHQEPEKRPDANEVIETVKKISEEYQGNKSMWDGLKGVYHGTDNNNSPKPRNQSTD